MTNVFKNISLVVISRLFASGLYFISNMLVINNLSVADYSRFGLFFSAIPFIAFIGNLGTNKAGLVLIKRNKLDISEYLYIRYMFFLLYSLILVLVVAFIPSLKYAVLCGFSLAIIELGLIVFQIKQQFNKYALINISRNTFWFIFLVIATYIWPGDLYKSIESFLSASLISLLFSIILIIIYTDFKPLKFKRLNHKTARLYKTTKVFFVTEFSNQVMMRLELWVIGFYISVGIIPNKELAIFNAAFMLAFILPLLSNSIYNALLPGLMDKNNYSIDNTYEVIKNNKFKITILTVLLSIVGVVFINNFLPEIYKQSIIPFLVICVAVTLSFFTNLFQINFLKQKKEGYIKFITIRQLVLSVLCAIVLIPLFGATGAAVALAMVRFYGLYKTNKMNKLL